MALPVQKENDFMATEKASDSSSPPFIHPDHRDINHLAHPHYRETSVAGQPAYGEHGALVDHKVPQEDVVQSGPDFRWSRVRHYLREPLSEFFGVFILIMFGDGVVAQVVLSKGEKGDYQSISWGWGYFK
jgi:aquaglyceroporin related protein, other eukaryote